MEILTARRRQFLQKLIDIYAKTGETVHYGTIAKALGVSKWTAYDMMKRLEKLGYLARNYAVNPGETGRSQIVFQPTEKALQLSEQYHSDPVSEEWLNTKSRALKFLNRLKHLSFAEAMQTVQDELPKAKAGTDGCAYIIGLLLVYLRKLGGKTELTIKSLVQNAPTDEMRMAMFAGTVLGAIIQAENNEIGGNFADLVKRYQQWLAGLTDLEKNVLSDFLVEALA